MYASVCVCVSRCNALFPSLSRASLFVYFVKQVEGEEKLEFSQEFCRRSS